MNQIQRLKCDLERKFPDLPLEIDPPADMERGTWHLDVHRPGASPLVVEWRSDRGFGVSSTEDEDGYGIGPDEVYPNVRAVYDRVERLIITGGKTEPPRAIRLAGLRQLRGLTQGELAERAGVKQANISRIERRGEDIKIGTLARIVAAMGARLALVARFPHGTTRELELSEAQGSEISEIAAP